MVNTVEMELAANGLTLRAPVDEDAAAVADAVQSSLDELVPWMPWASAAYDAEAALAWIRGETGDEYRFVMRNDAGDVVGSCGINGVSKLNRSGNLGYWVRSDQVGNEYATTATQLVRKFGHEVGELHRIEVLMSVRNHASRRVAEKAGAYYEGALRGGLLLHGEYHDVHSWSFVPD